MYGIQESQFTGGGGSESLELKDMPTITIYGIDKSILYIEREVVKPVKRVITGEKETIETPKSDLFPPKVERILDTPYYELSDEEKQELVKDGGGWIWLLLGLALVVMIFSKSEVKQ